MPDIDELLRSPRKGDPVTPSPAPLDRYRGSPSDACALGYRMAANILVESIASQGQETFLFYPVVFLYRHHVELMLKNLISAFDEPAIRRATGVEQLTEEDRASLSKGRKAHSLQRLWDRLRPMVLALGGGVVPAETIAGMNWYIQQINEIDPHSEGLRYGTGLDDMKARLEGAQAKGEEVDLRTFAKAMERLAGYLSGLDTYVAEIISHAPEMP